MNPFRGIFLTGALIFSILVGVSSCTSELSQPGGEAVRMVTSDPLSTREPEIKYPGGNATADPDAVAELQLIEQLKDHELASICRVIRDLTLHKRLKKMNDNDSSTLERSRNFLINEWSLALSIPVQQAENELRKLLDVGENNS